MSRPHGDQRSTKSVVVVRHGERLDYIMRDRGENWIPTSQRPWDPPLTENGQQQAKALGEALPGILQGLNLPQIAAFYSSPFHRCRQTAVGLASSTNNNRTQDSQVKVELGLSESINENWFRSWAVQGTDGTWGYMKKESPELDPETLHPSSKQPVQPLLNWKIGDTDEATRESMDPNHISKSKLDTPYTLYPPKFESSKMQQDRMAQTLGQLSEDHLNQTFVMVSHGGPVTHLYESLTKNEWNAHGVSKYCCYSIYQKSEGDNTWTPLAVNQVLGEEPKSSKEQKEESKAFTWA